MLTLIGREGNGEREEKRRENERDTKWNRGGALYRLTFLTNHKCLHNFDFPQNHST